MQFETKRFVAVAVERHSSILLIDSSSGEGQEIYLVLGLSSDTMRFEFARPSLPFTGSL